MSTQMTSLAWVVSHSEAVARKTHGEANLRLYVQVAYRGAVEDVSRSCHEQLTRFCDSKPWREIMRENNNLETSK